MPRCEAGGQGGQRSCEVAMTRDGIAPLLLRLTPTRADGIQAGSMKAAGWVGEFQVPWGGQGAGWRGGWWGGGTVGAGSQGMGKGMTSCSWCGCRCRLAKSGCTCYHSSWRGRRRAMPGRWPYRRSSWQRKQSGRSAGCRCVCVHNCWEGCRVQKEGRWPKHLVGFPW